MQGEPGVDYDEPNLNPLVCDLCKQQFDSIDALGEHQKKYHNMWNMCELHHYWVPNGDWRIF